jgi:hypothetical protein
MKIIFYGFYSKHYIPTNPVYSTVPLYSIQVKIVRPIVNCQSQILKCLLFDALNFVPLVSDSLVKAFARQTVFFIDSIIYEQAQPAFLCLN